MPQFSGFALPTYENIIAILRAMSINGNHQYKMKSKARNSKSFQIIQASHGVRPLEKRDSEKD